MASRAHHVTSMAATSSCCVVPVLVKTSAHYITHPALRMQSETEKQEKAHSQREKTEKEAQKASEDAARKAQICSVFWVLSTGPTAAGGTYLLNRIACT